MVLKFLFIPIKLYNKVVTIKLSKVNSLIEFRLSEISVNQKINIFLINPGARLQRMPYPQSNNILIFALAGKVQI